MFDKYGYCQYMGDGTCDLEDRIASVLGIQVKDDAYDELSEAIARLQQELDAERAKVVALSSAADANIDALRQTEATVDVERERADDLDSDNRELVRQRREANERAYGAESEAERLQLALAAERERADRAEKQRKKAVDKVHRMDDEWMAEREARAVEHQELTDTANAWIADARKAEARAEAAEAALAQADENVMGLTQRIHELEGEVDALQFSMDKCSRELAATEDELERVNGAVERLRIERDAALAPTAEAVEKNVCELLDLYHDREQQALAEVKRLENDLIAGGAQRLKMTAEVGRLRAEVERLRDGRDSHRESWKAAVVRFERAESRIAKALSILESDDGAEEGCDCTACLAIDALKDKP